MRHPIPEPTRAAPSAVHRILVVEDDADIRQLNTEALLQSGYEVDAAEDGAVAWDALQVNSYDLVITDRSMPKVCGIELLKKLRAARMDLPVIMATGILPHEEFQRYPWLQPAAVLIKPYTIPDLIETVRTVLTVAEGPREAIAPELTWQSPSPAIGLRI